ncbi:MAG: hypothetical protein JNK08_03775 [Sediminibacterium sp.]|nr:hypothetical protein [Sediminibacterium sp.]
MKRSFLLICLLPLLALAQPETYYVTFLKGTVINQQTKQAIKIGDKLSATDKLIFKDSQGKLACISPGKGRFELSGQKLQADKSGELLAILKSNLLPVTNTYHLSTRALVFEGYDPKTYFNAAETGERILLLTDKALPIIPAWKIDAAHFFFIQYNNSNGKPVTKKIPYSEKGLLFNTAVFTDEAGNAIDQKVMLCYQAKENEKAYSQVLASFLPVLAETSSIKEQLQLIKKYSSTTDKKKLQAELSAHIYTNFGKIGAEELEMLMQ